MDTRGCDCNESSTFGGSIGYFGGENNVGAAWTAFNCQGETLGNFGGEVPGRGRAGVIVADIFRPLVK